MMVTTRCTRTHVLVVVLFADEAGFDVGLRDALRRMAEFGHDEFCRIGIDHVGDLVHGAGLHQELDEVDRTLRHRFESS